jgi:serine/threonine protein kinase
MHMTIRELQRQNPSHWLNEQILKWTLFNLLSALSFLHDEPKVTHRGKICGYSIPWNWTDILKDINPSNIMLTVSDESLLWDFEPAEIEEPSPMKVVNDVRTIYGSRRLVLPKDSL